MREAREEMCVESLTADAGNKASAKESVTASNT